MAAGQLASALAFGIQSHDGTFIEAIDVEATVEVAELLDSEGKIGRAHPYKNMAKGTVKGHDTVTMVPGAGDSGVDGITSGVTIITSVKGAEKNDNFTGWEYAFNHYPDATALT